MEAMLETKEIDAVYPLTEAQVGLYREKGFIKLKDVFSRETLRRYGRQITAKVKDLNTLHLPMEERTTYQRAFLQVMNIWEKCEIVKEFVLGKRLARIASQLMGVRGVRLYHDQALYKEPGGGFTPWHADQYYWPLTTAASCTAWVPLQETPHEMGPLAFASGSHRFEFGRDLRISDESEAEIQAALAKADLEYVDEPFDLGEVSFHAGWTFHRAGPNVSDRPREVMTIIYMDGEMRLAKPKNENQERDHARWCPGAVVGEIIDTPLNPVIFRRE